MDIYTPNPDPSKILYIKWSDIKNIKTLEGYKALRLKEAAEIIKDRTVVDNVLNKIIGKDSIERLDINTYPSDNDFLSDLDIIKHFPNLKDIAVMGDIETLRGIENSKIAVVDITSLGPKSRDFQSLANSNVRSLILLFVNKKDFKAVEGCKALEHLTIGKCPSPNFEDWQHTKLSFIKFWHYCKFKNLKDMYHIKTLKEVSIGACLQFEELLGDNSNIENLTVDGSRKFKVETLKTCPNLKSLLIGKGIMPGKEHLPKLENLKFLTLNELDFNIADLEIYSKLEELSIWKGRAINLSELPYLPFIKRLALSKMKINFDTYDLKSKMPNLEELILGTIKKADTANLIESNPNVKIVNLSKVIKMWFGNL